MITIEIKGIEPNENAYGTVRSVADVFEQCLTLIARKSSGYGNAWQEQGWMGNLARVMSKTARLKNMLWREMDLEDSEESVHDTMLDQINLVAFMTINRAFGNKWGDRRG